MSISKLRKKCIINCTANNDGAIKGCAPFFLSSKYLRSMNTLRSLRRIELLSSRSAAAAAAAAASKSVAHSAVLRVGIGRGVLHRLRWPEHVCYVRRLRKISCLFLHSNFSITREYFSMYLGESRQKMHQAFLSERVFNLYCLRKHKIKYRGVLFVLINKSPVFALILLKRCVYCMRQQWCFRAPV